MDSPTTQHYNRASNTRRQESKDRKESSATGPSLRTPRSTMAKNFYQYTGPGGQTLHGYQRRYKKHQLRKKGFLLNRDAEKYLRQTMDAYKPPERDKIRTNP